MTNRETTMVGVTSTAISSFMTALAAACGCDATTAIGAEAVRVPAPPVVTIPLSAAVPKVEGTFGEKEAMGPTLQGFYQPNVDLMDRRGGRFLLACDGKALYVAVETPLHPRYGPVARNQSPYGGLDPDEVVLDDSLEIWLVPSLSGEAETSYQVMFNTLGGYSLRKFEVKRKDFVGEYWDVKGQLSRSSVVRDCRWTIKTAIPLAALGMNAPGAGLRLRVCRNYKLPFVPARDNLGVIYYKTPASMMQVRFQQQAPVMSEPDWVGQKTDRAAVTLRNPTQAAMKVQVAGTTVELAPGAAQEVRIPIQSGEKNVRQAELTVTAPDGTVIHRRTARWIVTDESPWEEVL